VVKVADPLTRDYVCAECRGMTSHDRIDEMVKRLREEWTKTGLAPAERLIERDLRIALYGSMHLLAEQKPVTETRIASELRLENLPADAYVKAVLKELPEFGRVALDIAAQARTAHNMDKAFAAAGQSLAGEEMRGRPPLYLDSISKP
jgi:hypothetical protein